MRCDIMFVLAMSSAGIKTGEPALCPHKSRLPCLYAYRAKPASPGPEPAPGCPAEPFRGPLRVLKYKMEEGLLGCYAENIGDIWLRQL